MGKVARFEDLVAWQKAHALARDVYFATRGRTFSRDFGFVDQIRRSALSIPSNIAEGFDRLSPGDFHRFLVIAKGSCGELRSQLHLARDVGHLDGTQFERLYKAVTEVGRVLSGLRMAIAKQKA